ncbi:LEAF RUST 10 DISEASE-RESISTANCE LOCUS RECEPTOR-LIKE PROTEIN KINASE-like 2.4 [Arachis stenosperma]|uniref:LEAF RUST 10 DISEASE-RESISTANCE LOCUS RECEPTOR-LIKE PROTEIN KINASE-like 2.4 n=1 Tax=Arachis stenosperma TaxID=217475 RepID=UPI0025ACACED|nr:LEAF RUST 10 DISEASE-RESISTANCE LOCUS RECEPTOR-LIKE PROTEIN KINASE-like 2.4 [Arachis stenosperma]
MDWHVHSELPMVLACIGTVISLLLTAALPPSLSQSPPSNYSLCKHPYECGKQQLYYPFWGGNRPRQCGGDQNLQLTCKEENEGYGGEFDYAYIETDSQGFKVVGNDDPLNTTFTLVPLPVADGEHDVCSMDFNYSLNYLPLTYNQKVHNITIFYGCTYSYPDYHSLGCGGSGGGGNGGNVGYYNGMEKEVLESNPGLQNDCKYHIQVAAEAVLLNGVGGDASSALPFGEGVLVNSTFSQDCKRCVDSGGSCGSNHTHPFTCYCPHGSIALPCPPPVPAPDPPPVPAPGPRANYRSQEKSNGWTWQKKVIIGATAAAVIAGLLSICYFTYMSPASQEKYCFPTKGNHDIETFLKNHGVLTIKRYKFSDVKKMTNSFKVKLGQGGFGVVYKGKLSNDFDVAVKMLNPSKGNGEEFINEVASISRTSHVNVVALLGFCLEGHKKVLIYEFMSNGSLDNFIYKKNPKNTPLLSWDNLYQISIGIARGLEYLHRGCNILILHFDIKPHNILLDENFCPKISDFGLAKLCPRKESHISMSETRGTIGYIAPEVWSRHLGRVSHKSDVYSYGMMLLEMVGMKENILAKTSHTSEMYFPDWIYKRLDQGTQLGPDDDGEVAIEENDVVKKMTIVGLWCIQPIPNDRPTMSRVVEMLEGSMNSLEMPPRPVLSSIRVVVESSSNVVSLVESSSVVSVVESSTSVT